MNGLDSVIIKNFQSHELSELQFVSGVNVIIGPSDAGKSAIFRALNLVASNRPLGDGFRSEWGGETRVELQTMEGHTVSRVKDKNMNAYMLGDPADDPIVFKAFGSDPPEDILSTLTMDTVNIQSQTDPPFLLTDSPGEVAQKLNQAASIDDIDRAIAGLRRGHNNLRQSIKSGENRLEEQQEELAQYEDLPKLERKVEELEDLEKERQSLEGRSRRLSNLTNRARELQESLAKAKDVEKSLALVTEAQELDITRKAADAKMRRLSSYIQKAQKTEKALKSSESKIKRLEEQYKEIAPDTCPLCGNPMK